MYNLPNGKFMVGYGSETNLKLIKKKVKKSKFFGRYSTAHINCGVLSIFSDYFWTNLPSSNKLLEPYKGMCT